MMTVYFKKKKRMFKIINPQLLFLKTLPDHRLVSAQTDHHQDNDDDDDDQDDRDHPGQDLTVRVVLGAGTHVMVQVVVADVGVHAGVTQTLVNVLLTVFPLVASGTVTAVVRVKVVGSVGVLAREDAGRCKERNANP